MIRIGRFSSLTIEPPVDRSAFGARVVRIGMELDERGCDEAPVQYDFLTREEAGDVVRYLREVFAL